MVKTQRGDVHTLYHTGAKKNSNKKSTARVDKTVVRSQLVAGRADMFP